MLLRIGAAVAWPTARVVLLVATIAVAEHFVSGRFLAAGDWLHRRAPDPALYSALAETIAQIAGAFLGLYLAALSVVVSTSYATAPPDVRSLLITEPSSSAFLQALAFTTGAALIVLGIQAVGWTPGTVNFWFLAVLSLISVFGVVQLGLGVLTLFDPAAHTGRLAHAVFKAARSATGQGFRARDRSFQAAYQRDAEQSLATYERLVQIAIGQEAGGRSSLIQAASQALALLEIYLELKPAIPHESLWFKRTGRYPSWFRASHSTVEMAEQTGTLLQPEAVGDEFWLEGSAIGLVVRVGDVLADRQDCEGILRLANAAERSVEVLAGRLRFEDALRLHRALLPLAKRVARLPISTETSTSTSAALYQLGAVDALFRALTGILVAGGKAAAEVGPMQVRALGSKLMKRPERYVVGSTLPTAVQHETTTLRRCLAFERAVEGRLVTPGWFVENVLGAGFAQAMSDLVTALVEEAEVVFPAEATALVVEKQALVGALVSQVGLEWCDKFEFHSVRVARARQGLSAIENVTAVQAWPSLDWGGMALRVTNLRDRLLQGLAQSALALPSAPPSGESPDMFGYAYFTLARECYRALAEGKQSLFESLFTAYFPAALKAYTRVGVELKAFPQDTRLTISADVLADIVEISGYALAWTELDGGDAWKVVQGTWERYLASVPDVGQALKFITMMVDYRRTAFVMSTGDLRRTAWHQDFERRMRQRGLHVGPFGDEEARAEPLNVVARAFVRHSQFGPHAGDVFLVEYLFKRPEASGLTPTRQMTEWSDAVEIELRRVREQKPPRRFWL